MCISVVWSRCCVLKSLEGNEIFKGSMTILFCFIRAPQGHSVRPGQSAGVISCTKYLMGLNTCSVFQHDVVFRAVTHPLSAAAAWHLHQPRGLAGRCIRVLCAQRDARDAATYTVAQLPAGGSERLTLLVPHTQVLTDKCVLS